MLACLALCTYVVTFSVPIDAALDSSAGNGSLNIATTGAAEDMTVETKTPRFSVSLYYADVEFDEVELEDSSASATLSGVSRERVGVQVGFEEGYARIYREEIGDFEGFGIGVGAQGGYVPKPSDRTAFLIDYDVSVDLGFLEVDEADLEMLNLAIEGKVGAGVAIESFHAAAGLAGSFITGTIEASGFEDVDLESQNFGLYVGFGFQPLDIPVKARFDLHFGDIEGVALSIGYAF